MTNKQKRLALYAGIAVTVFFGLYIIFNGAPSFIVNP